MEALRYVRAEDQIPTPVIDRHAIDLAPFCGVWANTNKETRGIAKVSIREAEGELFVRIVAAGSPEPIDWGEVRASAVYAKDAGSKSPMAFEAQYDFGFLESLLQANLSLGLLVVAGLNTFKDGSGRSNYFSREFYYRAG